MVTFETFVERFRELPDYLNKVGSDLLMKHNNEIVPLANTQLMKGVNINEETMQKGYSGAYGKKRKKVGLQTSFVDLKFTGKYQDSKKLVKYDYGVDIRSSADYEAHLRANFPEHVGLTEPNAEIIAKKMEDDVAKEILTFLTK